MEIPFLSLLYPSAEQKEAAADPKCRPCIKEEVCEELGLTRLLDLKNSQISDYFTWDPAVIRYRQEALQDLLAEPKIGETLESIIPILFDIEELRRMDPRTAGSGESYLYSITEIELYVSAIDTLYHGFSELRNRVKSQAFQRLLSVILELAESDYYKELNQKLSALSQRVHEIKSITIGVNLDELLRPASAGVLSINAEPFKSGKVLDKILRMSFRNDAMTCIAPLVPYGKNEAGNRKEAMISAFHGAIEEVFRSSVRSWRQIAGAYVLESTDFLLRLLPEIEFISRSTSLMQRLQKSGNPICIPTLCDMKDKAFTATALYNPDVAMQIEEPMVTNDFCFDDNGRIYILTGPNRGGKSVITCAVGLAQALTQLGLYAPAQSLQLSPVDGIFTHFPEGADDTIEKGRLGEECDRLRQIFNAVTENSMILLDESLSSTGSYEASYIAAEILSGFGVRRCRGVFATHLHELAASTEEINKNSLTNGGVRIDNLVAGMEEGQRSFRIFRRRPDGKSYARDIAERYGLSFSELLQDAKKEKAE